MERKFMKLLQDRWSRGHFVCMGLDPVLEKIPKHIRDNEKNMPGWIGAPTFERACVIQFCKEIINATHEQVCAFKPNAAFFEELGDEGHSALREVVQYINTVDPSIPVIYDAKRGDIGNTNNGYVRSAFDLIGADAITVSPYMGEDSLVPFRQRFEKGIFVLCKTSNPFSDEFQNLPVRCGDLHMPLYEYVAHRVSRVWNSRRNFGLVVGATCPEELENIRKIVGDMPILIPGIGAQGGDIEMTVHAGKNSRGQGMIINLSRSVLYASSETDFAKAAGAEVKRVTTEIQKYI